LTIGKEEINWGNLKKNSLLVHKEIKIKMNGIFIKCFYLCKLVV